MTDTAPATQADIQKIITMIEQLASKQDQLATKQDLENLKTTLREEIEASKQELRAEIEKSKKEMMHYFDVVLENHGNDIFGAFGDRYESLREVQQSHGKRLNRVETKVGLRAA